MRVTRPLPWIGDIPTLIGQTAVVRMAFEGQDMGPLTQNLIGRMQADPFDAGVLMDLATVLLCQGGDLAARGLAFQAAAIKMQPTYRVRHGDGTGPKLLCFVVAGDFMANTPVDFLLEGSDATLILHYVDDLPPRAADLPEHDVAFLAIGEGAQATAALDAIGPALALWPRPVLNNAPGLLARLRRDLASQILTDVPGVQAPLVHAASRAMMMALATGRMEPEMIGQGLRWPLVLRPVGSHGGKGLVRAMGQMDVLRWLSRPEVSAATSFYLMPFVDYRGADGLYAKYRVAMIGGRPFASHMAQSTDWMVHYLSSEMDQYEDRRIEEAMWMAGFDTTFARRHAKALTAIQKRLGLDYYALDCAEAPDGRLLIFEVDTAMIIHDMDSAEMYPYKKPVMRKLFDGFLDTLERALPPDTPDRGRRVA